MKKMTLTILSFLIGLVYLIPTIYTLINYSIFDLPLLWSLISISLIIYPIYLAIALMFFPPAWIVLAWLLFWKTKPVR